MGVVKLDVAIAELRRLRDEADTSPVQASTPQHTGWKASVEFVMTQSLGADSSILREFRDLRYHIGVYTGAPGEDEQDRRYFAAAVQNAGALIEAAIRQLELLVGDDIVDGSSFDSELWNHVRHSVEEQRWEQVASQSMIFVEDKLRRWSGTPLDQEGRKRMGKDLFVEALKPGGPLSLGAQKNEAEGWRNLGQGFVAALGNVDRHGIQDRTDAKRYAIGVLGLASLLLTQIRFEHPQKVASDLHTQ